MSTLRSDSSSVEPDRAGRFESGSHIRVRRPSGYQHHGIYVSDDRVIQFGGRISDKPAATIVAASLAEFEAGGIAEYVQHGRHDGFRLWLPRAQPGEKVVERAEWLLANCSPGRYNVIGNNCEHMANWCTIGGYSESHQVRTGFGVFAAVELIAILYLVKRSQTRPVGRGWYIGLSVISLAGMASMGLYNYHIWRFWKDIGHKWAAHEHRLPQATAPGDGEPNEGALE